MIAHLLSYEVRDFVLFSEEILSGVYESYNQGIWPMQFLWLFFAIILIPLGLRNGRMSSLILAASWFWVGIVFHLKYFQEINWAARYYGWSFILEGFLILIFGVWRDGLIFKIRYAGLALFILSLIVPVHFMLFGWGPDHTAAGTIGIFFMVKKKNLRNFLMVIPIIWIAVSILTYYGLK